MELIGSGIRAGRLSLGLSQRQLAARVGLCQSTISRLETGTLRGIRFKGLALIVGVIRMSPVYEFPDDPSPPSRRLPGQPRT